MKYKLIFISIIFFSGQLFSQTNSKGLYNTTTIQNHLNKIFDDSWLISLNGGITHFRGQINNSSIGKTYGVSLDRDLGRNYFISAKFSYAFLNGQTEHEHSKAIYDPYNFYEDNGEYFNASVYEFDIMFAKNIIDFVPYLQEIFFKKNGIGIFYNAGVGVNSFSSIRFNNETDSYIYAYGYDDLNGNLVTVREKRDLPRSGVFLYGIKITYEYKNDIIFGMSSIMRIANTDFLDAFSIKEDYSGDNLNMFDKFRSVEVGITFKI